MIETISIWSFGALGRCTKQKMYETLQLIDFDDFLHIVLTTSFREKLKFAARVSRLTFRIKFVHLD